MRKFMLVQLLAISFLFPVRPFTATAQSGDNLGGPPFSKSEQQLPMPEDWQQRPIHYEEWAQGADLALSLDQQLYAALLPLVERYAAEQRITIKVQEGTCGTSSGQLIQKSADATGFCCPPGYTDRLPGVAFHTIGIAALHIIVNKDNPVNNLSLDQVRKVFQGQITSWQALPGMEQTFTGASAIHPIARLHCKNRPGHWRLLLDNEDLFSASAHETGTIRDMITKVASDKNAIGYEVFWHINLLDPDGNTKSIRINNSDPNRPEDIISLTYPLYRTFNVTTWSPANTRKTLAQRLVEYLQAHIDEIDPHQQIVPAYKLRQAGWKFTNNELTGEPE